MKLINKLIPLSIVTAATALTPLASCSIGSVDTYDITNPYKITIKAANPEDLPKPEGEEYTADEIIKFYAQQVNNNPEILRQDILYYETLRLPEDVKAIEQEFDHEHGIEHGIGKVNEARVSVSDAKISTHTQEIDGEDVTFYTIDLEIEYIIDYVVFSPDNTISSSYRKTFNTKYHNIPIQFHEQQYGVTGRNYWFLTLGLNEANQKKLNFLPDWYVDFNLYEEGSTTQIVDGKPQTNSWDYSNANTIRRLSQITKIIQDTGDNLYREVLDCPSYYLSNLNSESSGEGEETSIEVAYSYETEGEYPDISFTNTFEIRNIQLSKGVIPDGFEISEVLPCSQAVGTNACVYRYNEIKAELPSEKFSWDNTTDNKPMLKYQSTNDGWFLGESGEYKLCLPIGNVYNGQVNIFTNFGWEVQGSGEYLEIPFTVQ